ncbi:hypothetical protein [Xenorhabdus bovienii]|uniref:hypothetical protein n=1 Tax=Xenorhabdus bovienii TaxID=40576 RepID=UPI0023B32DB1|nr:hypothetical protein [Xenorhabdus bovienii]
MKLLNRKMYKGVITYYVGMSQPELIFLKNCLHDILLKFNEIEENNYDKLAWLKAIFSEISNCLESNIEQLKITRIAKEYIDREVFCTLKLTSGEHDLLVQYIKELKYTIYKTPSSSNLKPLCNDVEELTNYFEKLQYFGVKETNQNYKMTKTELIEYLHSAYSELTIDTTYIKGYSEEDISKLEYLYDIKIQGQLLEFLIHMGRCSGGLFESQPLLFYWIRNNENKIKFSELEYKMSIQESLEYTFRDIQRLDLIKQKPFIISFENEGIYDYFLLTESDTPNLVYYVDNNYNEVVLTGLTFNEYLRSTVDSYRAYQYKSPFDLKGTLLGM